MENICGKYTWLRGVIPHATVNIVRVGNGAHLNHYAMFPSPCTCLFNQNKVSVKNTVPVTLVKLAYLVLVLVLGLSSCLNNHMHTSHVKWL